MNRSANTEKAKLTKNLKLKIKNAQLTKAAGLDKLKQKLAQAGSSDTKNSPASKAQTKEKSSKKVAGAPVFTPEVDSGIAESTARRIRAKDHSSFAVEPIAAGAVLPGDSSCLTLDALPQDLVENPSIPPKITFQEEELPEAFSSKQEGKESSEVTGKVLEHKEEPPIIRTRTEPKSIVSIKPKFGPTGKHINHLLAKTFKAPAKEAKTAAVAEESVQQPRSQTEPTTSANKQPSSGTNTRPTLATPSYRRDSSNNNSSKRGSERERSKRSDESVKAFTGRDRYGLNEGSSEEDRWRKKRVHKTKKQSEEHVVQCPSHIKIALPITVKDLAAEMKLKASELIQKLFIHGMTYVVNDVLDSQTIVEYIGLEFGCTIEIDSSEKEKLCLVENTVRDEINETDPQKLVIRSPIVAFMGHVDHGKTTLIDALRQSNIAASEAGAITQHMGAFKCSTPVGDITVLDTPGHEAFSAMRARGAETCDIVVLVVAGDEGIKEQTVEAIQHAKAANITIVVAINKCDKPNFNTETVYRQLAELDLLPEAWGGSIATINTSAKTGEGLQDLLEMLALQAEVLELKADPSTRARGIVIESELHKGLGAVATVLVQNGTLHLGEALVFNDCYGKVKTMHNEHNQLLQSATPSTPVLITGLSGIPKAGDPFIVVKNEKAAKEIINARLAGQQRSAALQKKRPNFDAVLQNKKTLKLIIKADVQGSIEALAHSILNIRSEKVDVEILSSGVGDISESDIRLASASKATVIGFHTGVESHAEALIKNLNIKVCLFDIIYHAIDSIKEIMTSLLDPIAEEKNLGAAEIKATFKSSQLGTIYGCLVTEGTMVRNQKIRIIRDKEILWKGSLSSLKRLKEDVKEVKKGMECGILLDNYQQAQIGDVLQCYEVIYHPQKL
ncbi:translation initiation factor IF-2 [Chlamydia sp.]|uniref:translation initiation factor IF-2 n=1 Tax=Chlamydia sp. TaxID=35827 RepID=UPI0025C1EE97|nr:translation initiation factor IF-2 [Chlamydia sp.]MBQ8498722.1 translation initiation factor IF-2 [Chlamydia sp.]